MTDAPSPDVEGVEPPALRDTFGQPWPCPPIVGPDASAGRGEVEAAWLVFLPGAFTPVCTSELAWLAEMAVGFARAADEGGPRVGVRVISCDAAPVLRRVAEETGAPDELVLLSDFWPHGAAADHYGLLERQTGRPRRVSVLVDADGVEHGRVTAEPGRARTRTEHETVTEQWSANR